MEYIENKTFDEILVGDSASYTKTLTQKDIELFAIMSGDINSAHLDAEYAAGTMFKKPIAHGIWSASLISTILGTKLPGPGAIYLKQDLKFLRPVFVGDTITAEVKVTEKDPAKKRVTLACACRNQDGKDVLTGEAQVLAPAEKVKRKAAKLPEIEFKY